MKIFNFILWFIGLIVIAAFTYLLIHIFVALLPIICAILIILLISYLISKYRKVTGFKSINKTRYQRRK